MDAKLHAVNRPTIRVDAMEKARGRAIYGNDLHFEKMLYTKSVYAAYAHAWIKGIDTARAQAYPGVACVITGRDVPGEKMTGELVQDQYPIAYDKVRHLGDVVAVVAAKTQEAANEAAKLIQVDYEPLPALFSTDEAEGNSTLITADYPNNICADYHSHKGDFEAAKAQAEVFVETRYETQHVEHAYIEPETLIAVPGEHGDTLTIYGSMQNPYMVRMSVARTTALPLAKVRACPCDLGGTFGGKLEGAEPPAVRAALCALRTGRPVKSSLTREESFRETHKRHPVKFHHEIAAKRDGTLTGLRFTAVGDCGAYVIMSQCVMWKILTLGAGPYKIPNVDIRSMCVVTNNVPTGSMRGFGTPQMIFAMENTMDELAERLGVSPLALRRQNIMKTGDTSPVGHTITTHEVSALQVLDKAAEALGYEEKYWKYLRENKGPKRRGVGIAVSMRGVSTGAEGMDVGRTYIEVMTDGSINLAMGLTEQGQGLRTTMAQITADALGADIRRVNVDLADTHRSPDTGAAIASRGTYIGGNAILDAARQIKGLIAQAIAQRYQVDPETVVFDNDQVRFGNEILTFPQAVSVCYGTGRTPAAVGTYVNHTLPWDEETGQGEPFCTYTYSCHAAEVEVDLATGKVEVLHMVGAHDAGRVINPPAAHGQVLGGLVMAQGMALTETLEMKQGVMKANNFDNYIIPTFMDVPDNESYMVENPDPRGPFGAKSLGEPATEPGAAAIACAVNHALHGICRLRSLPLNLEAVFFHGSRGGAEQ